MDAAARFTIRAFVILSACKNWTQRNHRAKEYEVKTFLLLSLAISATSSTKSQKWKPTIIESIKTEHSTADNQKGFLLAFFIAKLPKSSSKFHCLSLLFSMHWQVHLREPSNKTPTVNILQTFPIWHNNINVMRVDKQQKNLNLNREVNKKYCKLRRICSTGVFCSTPVKIRPGFVWNYRDVWLERHFERSLALLNKDEIFIIL